MADLASTEEAVTKAVAGKWSASVEAFRKALVATWSANGNTITAAQVRSLAARLDTKPAVVNAAKMLLPAAQAGDARIVGKTGVKVTKRAAAVIAKTATKPAEAKALALVRAAGADLSSLSGVLSVIGPLSGSVGHMQGAASYAVHAAANDATVSAADEAGEELVFVSERDACLECNGHNGDTGDAIEVPPLHPNCRCELQQNGPGKAEALKREALRSVLRGFSLPSESEAARLRAARAALSGRPNAPASVQRYARDAVKAGKFPRGRVTPGTR